MFDTSGRTTVADVAALTSELVGENAHALLEPPFEVPPAIPEALATMPPGPALAETLASVEIETLADHEQIVVLEAYERMRSHYAGKVYETIATISDDMVDRYGFEDGFDAAVAEVGTALHLTRRSSETEVEYATGIHDRIPQAAEWLEQGVIDLRRARVLYDQTMHLPRGTALRVVEELADVVGGLTTGQLRARLRKLCVQADPDDAKQRYESALKDRRLVTYASEMGTESLAGHDLPPERVAAVRDRINRLAMALRREGEARSIDQLRVDVFLDLLEGIPIDGTTSIRGVVDIRVDVATLARLNDDPAELAGFGPVVADIARQVAERHGPTWQWTLTHHGRVVDVGTTKRRPHTRLRKLTQARFRRCVFPGCRMPARQSDLDHNREWANGGATSSGNLAPLCRHHHRIKDLGWTYSIGPDRFVTWTSPTRHTYTTAKPPPEPDGVDPVRRKPLRAAPRPARQQGTLS